MNDWKRETLAKLGQGLEISRAAPSDRYTLRLHLGRWAESGNHVKWTGWISPAQLRALYDYLTDNPELMEPPTEPEEGPDPSDPWA